MPAGVFRAPVKAATTIAFLAREESEEVRLRDADTLGDDALAYLLPGHPARAAMPAGAGQLNLKPTGGAAWDQFSS
jgi:hypothetical protein